MTNLRHTLYEHVTNGEIYIRVYSRDTQLKYNDRPESSPVPRSVSMTAKACGDVSQHSQIYFEVDDRFMPDYYFIACILNIGFEIKSYVFETLVPPI